MDVKAHSAPWPNQHAIRLLETPGVLKIAHNLMYDATRLVRAGIRLAGPFWDTMLGAQTHDPDSPGFSLDEIASYYLDMKRWKHKGRPGSRPKAVRRKLWKKPQACKLCGTQTSSGLPGARAPEDPPRGALPRVCDSCADLQEEEQKEEFRKSFVIYNRIDSAVLPPIQKQQEYVLRKTGQLELFKNMMQVQEHVLLPLQLRGLRTDPAVRTALQAKLNADLRAALATWSEIEPGTSPTSVPQLKELLYTKWDLPEQYNKDGKLTTEAEAIHTLLTGNITQRVTPTIKRALEALLAMRRAAKWLETYANIADRIYPNYSPATKDYAGDRIRGIASTGRILAKGSEDTPPLQQIPEELRNLVIPDDGCVFVSFDYKQQELRLIAVHSGCKWLLARLDVKPDVFDEIGERFACDRTRSKNLFYGLWAYGGGARAGQAALAAKGFMVSEEECEEFIRLGRELCPELFAWHESVLARAMRDGFLTNCFGRRRYFRDIKRGSDGVFRGSQRGEAVNYVIQPDGADMQWNILIPTDAIAREYGGGISILLHDGFTYQVPEPHWQKFAERGRAALEREWPMIAPAFRVPVETKMGSNWRDQERV